MSLRDELHAAHKIRRKQFFGDPRARHRAQVYDFWLERIKRRGNEIAAVLCPQEAERPPITMEGIKIECAKFYRISVKDILSDRRTKKITMPRQIGMYLCAVLTTHSLPAIGRVFGKRDHTTVIHAVQQIERKRQEDERLDDEIQIITLRLGESFVLPGDVPEAA